MAHLSVNRIAERDSSRPADKRAMRLKDLTIAVVGAAFAYPLFFYWLNQA
jgi:hypothetical protein